MELFFTDPRLINAKSARFDQFESKHILKTLRKKTGDLVEFTDGKGKLYRGQIHKTHPELIVQIDEAVEIPASRPMINLGVGFIKQSRLDYIFEKGTELGINNFYLFAAKNSNYYSENISRWQKITRQAIKQSLRFYLPQIKCFRKFVDILDFIKLSPYQFIAYQNADESFAQALTHWPKGPADHLTILIGPEGGFTDEELRMAQLAKLRSVSFGNYRLRTETAAISAIAGINLVRNLNI